LGKELSGRIPLRELRRLAEALIDPSGDVEFELAFGKEGPHRAVIRGRVKASLNLECQRCRDTMEFPVVSDMCLALVDGLDEIELLPERYDPLLLQEPTLKLVEMIEDELLLALPQVPMHKAGDCRAPAAVKESGQKPATTENPFSVLSGLKLEK
jgi:uncharacterized protein